MIFFQKLINSIDMGICLLDKNLRILIWNSWLEDRTGRIKVELVNKNIGDFYPIFNKKIYQEYFSKLLSEVNNSVFLAGVLHPDFFNMSQERNFRYNTIFRSFNYNGTEHILIQVNDVTSNSNQIKALKKEISKRKKTASELKEKNIQLEELNKKLDREIAKAEIIHQTVLQKKLPLIEGFSLSAYYNPAVNLGGDFYKVIIKGNKAIIYLSDVTGHGLDSAFLSSFIKNTVDSYIAIHEEEFISPQKIAYFLQRRIKEEVFPDDYAISVFIAMIDIRTKKMVYTAAGVHTPPLVSSEKITLSQLVNYELPICNSINNKLYSFKEQEFYLEDGIRILFSTDGLFEQYGDNKMYNSRIINIFKEYKKLPAEVLVDLINTDLYKFMDEQQQTDDITFLILKVGNENSNQFVFPSTIKSIARTMELISQRLPSNYQAFNFLTGLKELVQNAIEHGNQFNPNKKITIKYSFNEDFWVGTVIDEGEGFNWQNVLQKEFDLTCDCDCERGRGIAMVNIFCDYLVYNRKGNRASLIIKVDKKLENSKVNKNISMKMKKNENLLIAKNQKYKIKLNSQL